MNGLAPGDGPQNESCGGEQTNEWRGVAALTLLVGGGVFMGAFNELVERDSRLRSRRPPHRSAHAEDRPPDDAAVAPFYDNAIRELEDVFGTDAVAAMINLPRSRGVAQTAFTVDGREKPQTNEEPALAPALRSAIWSVDPDHPMTAIQTLEQHIQTQLAGPRIISLVLGIFGVTALLLSALGIYGVMAHSVVQRKREIGIRMALGAGRDVVVGPVTRQGLRLAAIGLAMGAPIAFAIVRAIQSLVFSGDESIDPTLIVAVTATLIAILFTATFFPALRASRVHRCERCKPNRAPRYDRRWRGGYEGDGALHATR